MNGYLEAIYKASVGILKDNEEPRDLLISAALKHHILREVEPMTMYRAMPDAEELFGMKIEWTRPKPLTQPQIAIRTVKGDTRIVSMLDGDSRHE